MLGGVVGGRGRINKGSHRTGTGAQARHKGLTRDWPCKEPKKCSAHRPHLQGPGGAERVCVWGGQEGLSITETHSIAQETLSRG